MMGPTTPARDEDGNRGGEDGTLQDTARFRSWRLLLGTLATPLAWVAQMFIGEVLTTRACSLASAGRPSGPPAWAMSALIALSVGCFVLGVAGVGFAWRTVVLTRARRWHALDRRTRRAVELEWFLARVSVLSSAMFMFGLLSTDLAVIIVAPCGRW
ncbi:hypothetical protein [Paraburkholderia sp. XV]|uniref:hypothetical protein n=1 Tax=Paraburkholderia sp. XV TaxID=2831520 RepID=UPI001CD4A560|nr:hypothetical protein [Paraburkholderia sp. XV]